MPPLIAAEVSDHGAYTPTLIDRYPRLCGFVIGFASGCVLLLLGGCRAEVHASSAPSEATTAEVSPRLIVAERQFSINGANLYLIVDTQAGITCYALSSSRTDSISCVDKVVPR